ncbi:CYCXC family (seleno)protein [Candidatus Binatus sp.]|jgi:hypothetical protein|uniref:CYCXC family (seleno)protein n=1 Tax=Candidatus Binatus sp. TaxID=2811406 RepID=UPI003CA25EB6
MRRAIILGSSVVAILALAYLWLPTLGASSTENGGARSAMCILGHCCCAAPEAETLAADGAPERVTLDPNQFVGPVKQAYEVAKKNPALLAQLHCYCGCDKTYGHKSLLDCYRGTHASVCAICLGEALTAEQMSEQGSPVEQIRDALRKQYAGEN